MRCGLHPVVFCVSVCACVYVRVCMCVCLYVRACKSINHRSAVMVMGPSRPAEG